MVGVFALPYPWTVVVICSLPSHGLSASLGNCASEGNAEMRYLGVRNPAPHPPPQVLLKAFG